MANSQLISVPTIASALALGGAGAFYLYLRSQTEDVVEDVSSILRLVKLKKMSENVVGRESWTVVNFWDNVVKRHPQRQAMVFVDTGASYTYKQVDEISNRMANWAVKQGVKPGDCVALLMENRPEYVFTWLGLAKAGAITALINHNLQGKALLHSLSVCKAKRFVVGIERADRGAEAMNEVGGEWFSYGGSAPGMQQIDPILATMPITPVDPSIRKGRNANDHQLYIYTSGTTGNPKAGVITSLRFFGVGAGFAETFSVHTLDRIYCCLPLYHSAGGMAGLGMAWYTGGCFVFRSKFSKSNFWSDVGEHRCTVVQYIGELCRYLLTAPESADDRKHKVRIAIGNGLRKDVWPSFQKRFNIPLIGEFYGATEGNVALVNSKNKVGAVGYVSPLVARFVNFKIIKFDVEKEEPVRGADGLCIPCKDGEIGEIVGEIDDNDPTRKFIGYTNKAATQKKVLANVFAKGDKYFRSGDLMYKDARGYYYFVDRIGDTFRWKGENVATGEVALAISDTPGVKEVNVYGVSVPGHDGRAGMCTLVVEPPFSFEALYARVNKELPSYARPLFLRMKKDIEITSTFKHKKVDLQNDGFDPSKVSDELYFRDDTQQTFVRITPHLYDDIVNDRTESKL